MGLVANTNPSYRSRSVRSKEKTRSSPKRAAQKSHSMIARMNESCVYFFGLLKRLGKVRHTQMLKSSLLQIPMIPVILHRTSVRSSFAAFRPFLLKHAYALYSYSFRSCQPKHDSSHSFDKPDVMVFKWSSYILIAIDSPHKHRVARAFDFLHVLLRM